MDLSIIIVTFNTEAVTLNCLSSIFNSLIKYSFEVIVVDNNSKDQTVINIQKLFPQVKLISSEMNLGFSKGNNLGIKTAKGKYLLLLNSDTIVLSDSIQNLVEEMETNQYDVAGPKLLNQDMTIQRSWFNFPSSVKTFFRITDLYILFYKLSHFLSYFFVFFNKKPAFLLSEIKENIEVDYLSFAAILIRRKVLESIGALDEKLMFYHEDCEYGIRSNKNNFKINYCVNPQIIHLGGSSSSNFSIFSFENDVKGLLHIYRKHYSKRKFQRLKISLFMALTWRIVFWHFGLYKRVKKFGFYSSEGNLDKGLLEMELYNKYKELRKNLILFKYESI